MHLGLVRTHVELQYQVHHIKSMMLRSKINPCSCSKYKHLLIALLEALLWPQNVSIYSDYLTQQRTWVTAHRIDREIITWVRQIQKTPVTVQCSDSFALTHQADVLVTRVRVYDLRQAKLWFLNCKPKINGPTGQINYLITSSSYCEADRSCLIVQWSVRRIGMSSILQSSKEVWTTGLEIPLASVKTSKTFAQPVCECREIVGVSMEVTRLGDLGEIRVINQSAGQAIKEQWQ